MAIILHYFTEVSTFFRGHRVKVDEDVVVKKFMFIS